MIETDFDKDCSQEWKELYKRQYKLMVESFLSQACEWLKNNKEHPFIGCEDCCLIGFLTDDFIEDFRREMKEKLCLTLKDE